MLDLKGSCRLVFERLGPKGLVAVLVALLIIFAGGYYIYVQQDTGGLGYLDADDLVAEEGVDTEARKRFFFEHLAIVIDAENTRILALRAKLEDARENEDVGSWIADVAADYGMEEWTPKSWSALLARVDTVPVPLALIQAAKESSWGRSRFAQEGNNLFGQWCFTKGCGLVPKKRAAGATHEVQAFGSINHAIRAYLNNINSHRAYRDLRKIRARARAAGKTASSIDLARTLLSYSERGQAYVDELVKLINSNRKFMPSAPPVS